MQRACHALQARSCSPSSDRRRRRRARAGRAQLGSRTRAAHVAERTLRSIASRSKSCATTSPGAGRPSVRRRRYPADRYDSSGQTRWTNRPRRSRQEPVHDRELARWANGAGARYGPLSADAYGDSARVAWRYSGTTRRPARWAAPAVRTSVGTTNAAIPVPQGRTTDAASARGSCVLRRCVMPSRPMLASRRADASRAPRRCRARSLAYRSGGPPRCAGVNPT